MSTIINGTTDAITFPDATIQNTSAIVGGKVPYTNLPAGSVLQVVNASSTTLVTTTSTSFVTTGLAATITPKFSTSKIQIIADIPNYNLASNSGLMITIYRGATNLGTGAYSSLYQSYTATTSLYTNCIINIQDAPATTSSTTYTVYFAALGSQTTGVFQNGITGTITLFEVAA